MVFAVVMYRCESSIIKKPECQRTDAFELQWWRRLLSIPWTTRKSNQSILPEINPDYTLEGLLLKHQYFGHLMRRAVSMEKTLMLGKVEGKRRRGWQRMRWLNSMDTDLSKLPEIVKDREAWRAAVHGAQTARHDQATEQQQQCACWSQCSFLELCGITLVPFLQDSSSDI